MRWALQVALDQGFTSVSIKSDALNVVNCLNKKSNIAAIELVMQDCNDLMQGLPTVVVQLVRREHNVEAHNLASLARIVGCSSWLGIAPPALFLSANVVIMTDNCIPNGCVPASV